MQNQTVWPLLKGKYGYIYCPHFGHFLKYSTICHHFRIAYKHDIKAHISKSLNGYSIPHFFSFFIQYTNLTTYAIINSHCMIVRNINITLTSFPTSLVFTHRTNQLLIFFAKLNPKYFPWTFFYTIHLFLILSNSSYNPPPDNITAKCTYNSRNNN